MKITRMFTFHVNDHNIHINVPFNLMAEYLNKLGWEIDSYEIFYSKYRLCNDGSKAFSHASFICNKEVEPVLANIDRDYDIQIKLSDHGIELDL